MTGLLEVTIIHHVGIVLILLWVLSSFNWSHPIAYFASLVYLYMVHEKYVMRLKKKVHFEEKRQSYQRRVLTDSETVRWLNHAIEKIWPVCMEEIVSQKILLPIIPWFLQKYKPWTVKETEIQHLYLGRSPPIFTEMRVLRQSTGDDHLVLELGMNFRSADDMSAILAAKLRKRLGLGMWTKLHLLGMHVEGKVLVGVKFLHKWPFLGRLRVCFSEPPYFQMTVKPIFTHGLDVTELPGISGWLDKLLAVAFEQTLVEPNMLVVDVDKFSSPQPENWFSVDVKEPVAHAIVEVIEAADMKPSDFNGLADPYVKGQLGPYRFRTKTLNKTLAPKWNEKFKIPVITWESPNELKIDVRDKDHFADDTLGECSINISDLRDGQRHDIWVPLQNIKMGRLHLAVTVTEGCEKDTEQTYDADGLVNGHNRNSPKMDAADRGFSPGPSNKSTEADTYEPIDTEGQRETGIWVHHPGSEVALVWEPRKGKSRLLDEHINGEGSDIGGSNRSTSGSSQNEGFSTDDSLDGNRRHSRNPFQRGLHKIKTMFRGSPKNEKSSCLEEPVPSPCVNLRAANSKVTGVKILTDDALSSETAPKDGAKDGIEENDGESKGNVKDAAKIILKHDGKTARGMKHPISRKASRKHKTDGESLATDNDASVVSEFSIEESPTSSYSTPHLEQLPVTPSNTKSGTGNDSFKAKELRSRISNDLHVDSRVEAEEVIPQNPAEEAIPQNPPKVTEGGDLLTESSSKVRRTDSDSS